MGKELVAIRPLVDELFPRGWSKWSRKHTKGQSRTTVWRWMVVAQQCPETDITDETKLTDLYRKVELAEKKPSGVKKTKQTQQPKVKPPTVLPFAAKSTAKPKQVVQDDDGIGGEGGEDEIKGMVKTPDQQHSTGQVTVEDDEDYGAVENDLFVDDDDEQESEPADNLGKALDLIHRLEQLVKSSESLKSVEQDVAQLRERITELSADAELLV
jgi:hypothetical protein